MTNLYLARPANFLESWWCRFSRCDFHHLRFVLFVLVLSILQVTIVVVNVNGVASTDFMLEHAPHDGTLARFAKPMLGAIDVAEFENVFVFAVF